LRHIHKACVRDRVLHHAIIRIIEPIFEKTFIFDSYSSRKGKGAYKAILRLRQFAWKLSKNNTITVWVLKCDIRKYFDSVDHQIIFSLLRAKIDDLNVLYLLKNIIESYSSRLDLLQSKSKKRRGMPLGNLTSQLFSNIYLNPLDHFVKRKLKEKYYIRYADDFLIISRDRSRLKKLILIIKIFLENVLKLELHPKKIELRKWSRGIDFLGYISFPHHTVLRTKTKRRMIRKIKHNIQLLNNGEIVKESFDQSTQSYLGLLKHCRSFSIYQQILKLIKC
jgi:retron-type reverse transcriptase